MTPATAPVDTNQLTLTPPNDLLREVRDFLLPKTPSLVAILDRVNSAFFQSLNLQFAQMSPEAQWHFATVREAFRSNPQDILASKTQLPSSVNQTIVGFNFSVRYTGSSSEPQEVEYQITHHRIMVDGLGELLDGNVVSIDFRNNEGSFQSAGISSDLCGFLMDQLNLSQAEPREHSHN